MAFDRAKAYLEGLGLGDRIQEFEVSSATVELAAKAVGVPGAQIAKTLSFKQGDGCALILAAGDARIDNGKYKAKFGMKAKMLTPGEAVEFTGHAVGGVCPFGIGEGVRVYTDVSLKRFDTVYPACGSGSSAVRLTCDELFSSSNSLEWIDVCKDWQEEEI